MLAAFAACLALGAPATAAANTTIDSPGDPEQIIATADDAANAITLTSDGGFVYIAEAGGTVSEQAAGDTVCENDGARVRCNRTLIIEIIVLGRGGDDTLTDDVANNALDSVLFEGEDGNDTLNAGINGTSMHGGGGDDTLNARTFRLGGDDSGDAGNDTFNGSAQADDYFAAEDGADTYNGGEATSTDPTCQIDPTLCDFDEDQIDYGAAATAVNVTVDGAANDGRAGENDNVKNDVDVLELSSHNDVASAVGSGNQHRILGNDGDDTATAGNGHDYVWGGRGTDVLDGGPGNDAVADGDFDRTTGVGSDRLAGGPGDDSLSSSFGGDDLSGGDGFDNASFSRTDPGGNPQPFEILLDNAANDGVKGAGEGDNVRNDIEEIATGAGDDTLVGSANTEVFFSGAGNDTLDPKGNVDQVFAGSGADTIVARDAGFDLVNCGAGTDPAVQADAGDRLDNCEARADTPLPQPPDAAKPVVTSQTKSSMPGAAFVKSRTITGVFTVNEDNVAQGGVTASNARIAKVGEIVLGEKKLPLAPAGKRTMRVKIAKKYARVIARKLRRKNYKVTLRVTVLDKAGNGTELRKQITIKKLRK